MFERFHSIIILVSIDCFRQDGMLRVHEYFQFANELMLEVVFVQ
jgi:hypothetical protein